MPCLIDLSVQITHYNPDTEDSDYWIGTARLHTTQPLAVGTHVGSSQLLTVCQVYYLGMADGTDKDHYAVTITDRVVGNYGNLGDDITSSQQVVDLIREQTPWINWTFKPQEPNEDQDL